MPRPRKHPPTETVAQSVEEVLWQNGAMTIDDLTNTTNQHLTTTLGVKVEVPSGSIRDAIHYHRNYLSTEDGALVVKTVGLSWVYSMTAEHEEIAEWLAFRERSVDTQLKTLLAVSETAVKVTRGNTIAGKRARLERKLIGRLVEDIAELRVTV